MKKNYETEATVYAEKYGIVDYKVKGSSMVYYESWFNGVNFDHYKATVNLKDMTENRQQLKRKVK